MTVPADTLDRRERQIERATAVAPYALLALSTVLALLTGEHGVQDALIIVGLAVLAAAWIALVGGRPALGPVYVAGLIALIAVLCSRDTWFASFFAFVGYVHSWQRLRRGWRLIGIAAVAAVSITTFMGGLPAPEPLAIGIRLLFIGALVALVTLFSVVGDVTAARSAERKRMIVQLEETLRENAGLHAQLLVQAREAGMLDERQRLAREIHDTIAQGLAGVVTQLQAAQRAAQVGSPEWERHVELAMRLARESLTEARRSVHAVGPAQLETARLPDAVAEVAARWAEEHGAAAEVHVDGDARPLHPEIEVSVLRIAQEALANAAKHARCTRVGVSLTYLPAEIILDVRDDGAGFDASRAAESGGFGVASMQARAARLGGAVVIESEPGAGTTVSARMPAVDREDPDA